MIQELFLLFSYGSLIISPVHLRFLLNLFDKQLQMYRQLANRVQLRSNHENSLAPSVGNRLWFHNGSGCSK